MPAGRSDGTERQKSIAQSACTDRQEEALAQSVSAGQECGKESAEPKDASEPQDNKRDVLKKLIQFPGRLCKVIRSIVQTCRKIWNKSLDIKAGLERLMEILRRDRTKRAIEKAKLQLLRLLKRLLPRKWNAYLHFGFEDPATTGQLLGYYWMFIGLWGGYVVCVPDFERRVLDGNLKAKGRVQVFWLISAAYHFLFDKDLVYLRKLGSEIVSK